MCVFSKVICPKNPNYECCDTQNDAIIAIRLPGRQTNSHWRTLHLQPESFRCQDVGHEMVVTDLHHKLVNK
ncbi:uncharacterized protein Dsimw501_GD28780 [Drosophila simulans]|uniref:Uncharacterized protein n=1 Tax=Drosophila simulans TaxID=7240 RepID=A0A0J9U828_DROSI|nr:uncharacterized protein Dsimw501_GD28780 [Drosophila simulans]